MMYPEIRHKAIPCLAFMKEAECVLYVGPELTLIGQSKFYSIYLKRCKRIYPFTVIVR